MVTRNASVGLGLALLALTSSSNADSRLWREQIDAGASKTIVVSVSASEAVSSPTPTYLWREQLDAARVQLAVRGDAGAPEYALWREQLASRAAKDDATRVAG